MKNDIFFDGVLTEEGRDQMTQLMEGAFEPFERQIRFAGLDPRTDLQQADLSGVDFSHSNLAGYDFTGADLRGATGIGVRWDATTVFNGTELTGSIFALPVGLGRFFAENVKAKDWLSRVSRYGATEKILWSADQLKAGAPHNDVAMPIAMEMFRRAQDSFLRSQLMFFMSPRLDGVAVRELVLTSLAEHSASNAVVVNALDIAKRRGLMNDPSIRSITLALLLSEHATVRETAMSVLMRHRPTLVEQSGIYNAIKGYPHLGATYVLEAARSLGEEYRILVRHPISGEVLKPNQRIDPIPLYLMARRWLRLEANILEERKGIPLSERNPSSASFTEAQVRAQMRQVIERHDHLKSFGIQFSYDRDLPDKPIENLPREAKRGE